VLLERDHRQLEKLLERAEKTDARSLKQRTALLGAITTALDIHEAIEEQVLYPALKAHAEGRDIVLEGYQEHHVADLIVAELQRMGKDDERWGAKLKVLKESIEHHIGEEEGEMFRTARAVMTRAELQRLGARMAAMKAKGERSTLSRA
jgi:hemerythrin-like domain-containing protein